MRVIPFRDVLWGVAFKLGLDPDQSNFLTNQAIPLGTYINEWVRRLYDVSDWPEWVLTNEFTPINRVVTWDAVAIDLPPNPGDAGGVTVRIGRVLKVYVVDPNTTDSPVDTAFLIRDDGIHVLGPHGSSVWVRYIGLPPRFTAVTWRPNVTYNLDALVYSPITGECYSSISSGNINHDPGAGQRTGITPVITQQFSPGSPGITAHNKIMRIDYGTLSPILSAITLVRVVVTWGVTTRANVSHTVVGGDTPDSVFTALQTLLVAALPVGYVVDPVDTAANTLDIEAPEDFFVDPQITSLGPSFSLPVVQVQPYLGGAIPATMVRQVTVITLGSTQVVQVATYTLVMTDTIGRRHIVDYLSRTSDDGNAILLGLIQAITDHSAVDPWLEGVYSSIDTASVKLTLSFSESVSVDASFVPISTRWWQFVPFPIAIADQVMTGSLGDLLKEWGQTDKGAAEAGAVSNETQISAAKFTTTPTPELSGQQIASSRYKA